MSTYDFTQYSVIFQNGQTVTMTGSCLFNCYVLNANPRVRALVKEYAQILEVRG